MKAKLIYKCGVLSLFMTLTATAQDTVIEPKDPEAAAEKVLDIFESKLESNPHFLAELLAEERDRVEKLLRAAQKDRPTARPWALDVQELFAVDVAAGKALQGKKRVAHFEHALEYLQETYDIAVKTLEESPNETLEAVLPGFRLDLSLAALEAGELELAKKHAAEPLRNNNDPKDWNYGNIIHNANQILGRCALREGKPADAKKHLLAAGATPGSPQLDSYGPQMQLARELLEKGEKESVLQYLDLVARFWANPDERTEANSKSVARGHLRQLEEWKKHVREGKVPADRKWLVEGPPAGPESLAEPSDLPDGIGLDRLNLTKDQATMISDWIERKGDAVDPAELAAYMMRTVLRDDQKAAFRKLDNEGRE